jgi:hypothetical protein
MADWQQTSNPYQASPELGGPSAALPADRRPGGLIAIAIIAIVFGGFGLFASVAQLGYVLRANHEAAAEPIPKQFAEKMSSKQVKAYKEAQQEMQQKATAVARRYRSVNVGFSCINLLLSAAILIGAILVLSLTPLGRSALVDVFLAAILFEVIRTAVQIVMQVDFTTATAAAMQRMFEAMPHAAGPKDAQAIEVAAVAAKIGFYIGIAFTVCVAATQAIFYIVGFLYLRRPEIVQLFSKPNFAEK